MKLLIAVVKPKGTKEMRHEKRREEPKRKEMRKSESRKVADPENLKGRGDGMKMATSEKRGTEKGRVEKGKNPPFTGKSDGMKVAMKGEARHKGSKLTNMRAAEQRVR
jgi:hypothetical protein